MTVFFFKIGCNFRTYEMCASNWHTKATWSEAVIDASGVQVTQCVDPDLDEPFLIPSLCRKAFIDPFWVQINKVLLDSMVLRVTMSYMWSTAFFIFHTFLAGSIFFSPSGYKKIETLWLWCVTRKQLLLRHIYATLINMGKRYIFM